MTSLLHRLRFNRDPKSVHAMLVASKLTGARGNVNKGCIPRCIRAELYSDLGPDGRMRDKSHTWRSLPRPDGEMSWDDFHIRNGRWSLTMITAALDPKTGERESYLLRGEPYNDYSMSSDHCDGGLHHTSLFNNSLIL